MPVAGGAAVNLVLTEDAGAAVSGVTALTLNGDGTVAIAGAPTQGATWVSDGSQITVTYTRPQVHAINQVASDGAIYIAIETDTGFKMRVQDAASAAVQSVGSYVFLDGPDSGSTQPLADDWQTQILAST